MDLQKACHYVYKIRYHMVLCVKYQFISSAIPARHERESMKNILQGNQNRYLDALEFPPKGTLITNHQGLITSFNNETQKILKLTSQELEGKNISDIIPEAWSDFQALLGGIENETERKVNWDDRTIIISLIAIREHDEVLKVLTLI